MSEVELSAFPGESDALPGERGTLVSVSPEESDAPTSPSPETHTTRPSTGAPETEPASTLEAELRGGAESEQIRELLALNTALRVSNEELAERVQVLEEGAKARDHEVGDPTGSAEENLPIPDSRAAPLDERAQQLHDSLKTLREKNDALRGHAEGLKQRLEKVRDRLRVTEERASEERSQREALVIRNSEVKSQLADLRKTSSERRAKLANSLSVTRERLASQSALWTAARKYFSLFRQGLLYDEIEKTEVDFSADTYLCLLPSTVPAALALSRKNGGKVICDCVENVEVHRHSLAPNLHPPTLEMVNLAAYGALTAVDGLMTVSNSVARTLNRFGPPVRVQPNYRRFEMPRNADDLRSRCGIPDDATVLVTSGNVVEGFETVLDAISSLPASVHLVALVRLSPKPYEAQVLEHIAKLGLSDRVHLLGFVPYDELAGLLADADLGLITLDPHNPNHSVSLPNRVFDFVTAGLPFVAPPLTEIKEFVQEHQCGATISEVSAEAWVSAITHVLEDLPSFRSAIEGARKEVTWESLEDGLYEFLGAPRTVTMLGFRDLTRYQRFLRTATTLSERGVRVKAVFFSENPLFVDIPNVEFYHFTDRYGRGPGLTRVTEESILQSASEGE